jgi:Na+-translocating ferredoxin:NAD+ oxidoreductase RnfG subunit
MISSLRLAGAAALCASLLLYACAKKTSDRITTSTDASRTGAVSAGFVDLPVYPGATELRDQAKAVSTSTGSFVRKVYTAKKGAKEVAEWYQSHLPAGFKGGILSAGDKAVGTFMNEHADGYQYVAVTNQPDGMSRIHLRTKHGK